MSNQAQQASTGWPSRHPVWLYGAIVVASLFFAALVWAEYAHGQGWSMVEKLYLNTYLKTGARAWQSPKNAARYELLTVVNHKGAEMLAVGEEVEPVPQADGATAYALTASAIAQGWIKPVWHVGEYNDQVLHAYLGHWIYGDQPLSAHLKRPAYEAFALWCVLLFFAVPMDYKRSLVWRDGRRLRGPEMVTTAQFNCRMHQRKQWTAELLDGVMFLDGAQNWLNSWLDRLLHRDTSRGACIPRERESMHILMMGDTGSGKSAAIRQVLVQVAERGELAIVYDPSGEFTAQFYKPERGDILLNPLDARCPFFALSDEIGHNAEALTLAASLFPLHEHENRFFVDAPRKIFAYLLTLKPTPEELVYWLGHPAEIDRLVRGTELESMIAVGAPAQRTGVLASLNMVADALKLLPKANDATGRFSTATWSKQRKGWIFITSTPTVRETLRPLISLWIDLLVLRLMHEGGSSGQKTWFVIDELASLQRLPQMTTALTESRKANCAMLLGVQGKAQVEALYGRVAEAMLSQPATKLFFKTSEPAAAEWISKAIGEVELERFRESRTEGEKRDSASVQREIVREPLVMPSEMMGLEPLHGYLKHGNYVVRLSTEYVQLPARQAAFMPRNPNPPRTGANGGRTFPPLSESSEPVVPAPQLDAATSTQQQPYFTY